MIPLSNLVRVYRDGDRWLALVGEDPQRGMLGAGTGPGAALAALAVKLVARDFETAAGSDSEAFHRPGFPPPHNVIRLTSAAGRWEARVGPDPLALRTLPAYGDSPESAFRNLTGRLHDRLWQFHPGPY